MSASINVRYEQSTSQNGLYGYALRVVVTNAVGMPAEIFMFQRGADPAPGAGEQPQDRFVCIADPVDLDEVPPLAPDLKNEIPYYRKSEVTLGFRCVSDRQEVLDDIAGDIATLVVSINKMAELTDTTEVTYA